MNSLSECDTSELTNLIHMLGEVALRQLIHLDVTLCKELKRRQNQQDEKNEKKKQKEKLRKSLGDNSKKVRTDHLLDTRDLLFS